MNRYLRMLVFVTILGLFTSLLLLGMDALTKERIASNEQALLRTAILDANQIAYTFTNELEVFEDRISIVTIDEYIFYVNEDTGAVSFQFTGGGVWGPITGILTLEQDLVTIQDIVILEQEETPGLGGVVAEKSYLATFIGKQMEIDIVKDVATLSENQVDAITGATRTSDAFEIILNTVYNEYLLVWQSQ